MCASALGNGLSQQTVLAIESLDSSPALSKKSVYRKLGKEGGGALSDVGLSIVTYSTTQSRGGQLLSMDLVNRQY